MADLPLATGRVALPGPLPDADPRTEVGGLGAAVNRMLGHVEDALVRRQASEERLRHFAADASHELRTPVANIRGHAELALRHRGPVPGEVRHSLERIGSESRRMTHLVDDLLLLARLDAGRPLEERPLDLTLLILNATEDARAASPDHHWRLDLPDAPVVITGDAHRLHQAIGNLLANARTHTPAGHGGLHRTDGLCDRHRDQCQRRRTGYPRRASAGGVQPLRPGRPGPLPQHRVHRTRPCHRSSGGHRTRGDRARHQPSRPHHLPSHGAPLRLARPTFRFRRTRPRRRLRPCPTVRRASPRISGQEKAQSVHAG